MAKTPKTYRALLTHEDGWWMIHIPELDLTTQAESRDEVATQAKGVIHAALDIPLDEFDCVVTEVETTR